MRILYLSKNLQNYKAANYQREFLYALSKKSQIFIYGPGYTYFNKNKSLKEITKIYGPFKIIFVGHAWLHDGNNPSIDPWPKSGLSKIQIKKFMFLNKEYANLNEKLRWIKKNKFDCVFSHYQDCKKWESKCRTQFRFLPFAYENNYFYNSEKKRKYDLAFSGVLQNSRKDKVHSDIRIRILRRLYFTLFNIPLFKRKKYRNLSIFWNSLPNNILGLVLSKIFKKYKFLSIRQYAQIQRKSKVYLNSKSPMNLISPRYFENIASGCIVVTEKNKELKKFIPKSSYMEFSNDLSDFDEVLYKSIIKSNLSRNILKNNSMIVKKKHNWDIRAKIVLKIIRDFLTKMTNQ